MQAQFTGKELKELLFEVPGIKTVVAPEQLEVNGIDSSEMKKSRQKRRVFDLISKACNEDRWASWTWERQRASVADKAVSFANREGRQLHFHFLRSPKEIIPGASGPAAVRLEKNVLTGTDGESHNHVQP